jgi:hypothetical protein
MAYVISQIGIMMARTDEKFASQNYHYVVVKKLIRGN